MTTELDDDCSGCGARWHRQCPGTWVTRAEHSYCTTAACFPWKLLDPPRPSEDVCADVNCDTATLDEDGAKECNTCLRHFCALHAPQTNGTWKCGDCPKHTKKIVAGSTVGNRYQRRSK